MDRWFMALRCMVHCTTTPDNHSTFVCDEKVIVQYAGSVDHRTLREKWLKALNSQSSFTGVWEL